MKLPLHATQEELHKLKVAVVVKNCNVETLNPDGTFNNMAQFYITILVD